MRFLKIILLMSVVTVTVLVVSLIIISKNEAIDNFPLVNTTVGLIRGLRADDGCTMFLGIPYSVVDKKNPFGAAIPNPIFKDVFNAFNDNAKCPQVEDLSNSTLDCLHLHIHVPKTSEKKLLPVIVLFHGGKFMFGASNKNEYGPKFLIRHKVIFVSFNYRLSVYGFMCLHTADVPGNQGLKDQLNALRWIKNNIKAFGGDDENITIIGNSSGGACVDLQLYFADEGLFQKVISSSGTTLDPYVFQKEDLNAAFKIASQLGFHTSNMSQAIKFLSNHTPSQVLLAADSLQMSFTPCVETKIPNVKRFITSHPVSTPFIKARNINILYGYVDNEMLPYIHLSFPDTYHIFDNLNKSFQFGSNYSSLKSIVRRYYIGDEPISESVKQGLIEFQSDLRFTHPAQRTLEKFIEHGGIAYHYVFSYVGGRNLESQKFNVTQNGAGHSDDIGYLFEKPELRDTPTPDDQLIIDRITVLYTNFAKYGDPTPSPTKLLPLRWLPITKDKLTYLNIDKKLKLGTRPFHKRLSFWDLFYRTYRENVRGYSDKITWDNI